MSNFCGKCGAELNGNELCPVCNSAEENKTEELYQSLEEAKKEQKLHPSQMRLTLYNSKKHKIQIQNNSVAEQKPIEPPAKSKKKAIKKPEKSSDSKKFKTKKTRKSKKEKLASLTPKQKLKRRIIKIVAVILAIVILLGTAVNVLVYYDVLNIPFINSALYGLGIKKEDFNKYSDFKTLYNSFTEVKITDENSAIEAVQSIAKKLGYKNAADELALSTKNTISGNTYYRLQQQYDGVPIFGRGVVVTADEDGNALGLTANLTDIEETETTAFVNQVQAESSIKKHLKSKVASNIAVHSVEEISDDRLTLYNLDDRSDTRLCYSLFADTDMGPYLLLVDSKTSEIVLSNSKLSFEQREFSLRGQEDEQVFDAESNGDSNEMSYTSKSGTKITVSEPKDGHGDDWYLGDNSDTASWNDYSTPSESAVDAMTNVQKAYGFFLDRFGYDSIDGKGSEIEVFVNTDNLKNSDNTDGRAYCRQSAKSYSLVFTKAFDENGSETKNLAKDADVVGHEYAHGIVNSTSGLMNTNSNKMPGAINEAVADILGYYFEADLKDNSPDWTAPKEVNRTSIKDKSENSGQVYIYKPDTVIGTAENDMCHEYSTVISYSAYLMSNGVNGTQTTVSESKMPELWYRTILSLPSNATFSNVRRCVELNAEIMGLSDDEKNCIAKAFDTVGVEDKESVAQYKNDLEISVLDKNSEPYDLYTVKLEKTDGTFTQVIKSDSTDSQSINLKNGEYIITATDSHNSQNVTSRIIKIDSKAEDSELKLQTTFGFDYTVKKGTKLDVLDMNAQSYDNYDIDINGIKTDGSQYVDKADIKDGSGYEINIPNGYYSFVITDNYETSRQKTVTVRVSNSGSDKAVSLSTKFGKEPGAFDQSQIPTKAVEFNGHYYFMYPTTKSLTWEKAQANCKLTGGYLATISSKEENDFLYNYIRSNGYYNAYFGLTDRDKEGEWVWDNGEEVTYTNWATGEPNKEKDSEDYAMFYYKYQNGAWNDGEFKFSSSSNSKSSMENNSVYLCEWGEYTPKNGGK